MHSTTILRTVRIVSLALFVVYAALFVAWLAGWLGTALGEMRSQHLLRLILYPVLALLLPLPLVLRPDRYAGRTLPDFTSSGVRRLGIFVLAFIGLLFLFDLTMFVSE